MWKVLLIEPMHEHGVELLREKCEVVFAKGATQQDLMAQLHDVDGLVVRTRGGRIGAELMDAAPRLKVIGRHGIGVENIDVRAAQERGIVVVNTPLANYESVAEHALGMIICLAKRMGESGPLLRAGQWGRRDEFVGREVFGATLGIVGFGRIGRRLAETASSAFEMNILYHDLVTAPELEQRIGARPADLAFLLSQADFVSVHVPSTPATRHLIGEPELRTMRPDAFLVNTARGPVVDGAALYKALRQGWIAGAGLDVFEEEPPPADLPLLGLPNVIATPHTASHTRQAMERMSDVAQDVLRVLAGEEPMHPVR